MAAALLLRGTMFRHPVGRKEPSPPIVKQWWCVSCLEQIALDSHGRCSNCGSNAVDRIINLEVPATVPKGLQNTASRSD
jgi:hypothetical protein